jgi:segregation and condensation protein B
LGLSSLDQLPLLSQVDPQASALAGLMNEAPAQASLSLDSLPDDEQKTRPPEVAPEITLNGEETPPL